jgi:tetratricopeptide (TPR) repeat protein
MRRVWLTSLVLFLATFAVFSRVLLGGFVQWDDDINIYANPHVQGLTAANLHWIFTTCEYPPRYVPLGWLGWAINCQLGGVRPFGFHLTDLLFHSANAVLAFLVIRKLLLAASAGSPIAADSRVCSCSAVAAFLWAVHPFRVESIAWAAGRNYVQPFFFLMISLLCYLRFQAGSPGKARMTYYWVSILCFACSLLSYPIGLTFVVVLVVLDFYPLRRFQSGFAGMWNTAASRVWLEKVPYALVSVLVLVSTVLLRSSNRRLGPPPSLDQFGIVARFMQACHGWAYFAWKPWLPFHLSPVYTTLFSFNPSAWPFRLSAIFVAVTTALLVCERRRWPWALALWASHLVLLVPMLGLTEHPHCASDRYGYLQGMVWAALLAALLWRLSARPKRVASAAVCAAALALFWAGLTVRQIGYWRNSVVLFEHIIRELGDHPYRSDIQWRLGFALAGEGKTQEAIRQYQASLRIRPTPHCCLLLAELLEQNGDRQGALTNCLAALALAPAPFERAKAGELLAAFGRRAEAINQYRQALALNPNLVPALNNLALILATDPDPENRNGAEAIQLAQRACALTDYQTPVLIGTLAAAYAEAGRFKEAIETAQRARRLAQAARQPEVAEKNRQLLELYQSGRPYRQPAPVGGASGPGR